MNLSGNAVNYWLKKENILLKRMPLFLATVVEMGPDYVLLRQHGNNQEFITTVATEMMEKLQPNSRVAINNSLTIVRILDRSVDVRAKVMELVELPDVSYEQVGGLETQIQEIRETVELPLTDDVIADLWGSDYPSLRFTNNVNATMWTVILAPA